MNKNLSKEMHTTRTEDAKNLGMRIFLYDIVGLNASKARN